MKTKILLFIVYMLLGLQTQAQIIIREDFQNGTYSQGWRAGIIGTDQTAWSPVVTADKTLRLMDANGGKNSSGTYFYYNDAPIFTRDMFNASVTNQPNRVYISFDVVQWSDAEFPEGMSMFLFNKQGEGNNIRWGNPTVGLGYGRNGAGTQGLQGALWGVGLDPSGEFSVRDLAGEDGSRTDEKYFTVARKGESNDYASEYIQGANPESFKDKSFFNQSTVKPTGTTNYHFVVGKVQTGQTSVPDVNWWLPSGQRLQSSADIVDEYYLGFAAGRNGLPNNIEISNIVVMPYDNVGCAVYAPSEVMEGAEFDYVVELYNYSQSVANGLQFNAEFPTAAIAGTPIAGTGVTVAVPTTSQGRSTYRITINDSASPGTGNNFSFKSYKITFKLKTPTPQVAQIDTKVAINPLQANSAYNRYRGDDQVDFPITVSAYVPLPDIEVTALTFGTNPVVAGSTEQMTVKAVNKQSAGASTSGETFLDITYPTGLTPEGNPQGTVWTYVSHTGTTYTYKCSQSVAPGTSYEDLKIDVQFNKSLVTSTQTIDTKLSGGGSAEEISKAFTVNIQRQSDIKLDLSADQTYFVPGETIIYTIKAVNGGTSNSNPFDIVTTAFPTGCTIDVTNITTESSGTGTVLGSIVSTENNFKVEGVVLPAEVGSYVLYNIPLLFESSFANSFENTASLTITENAVANVSETFTFERKQQADLELVSITSDAPPNGIDLKTEFTLTVKAKNIGPSDLTGGYTISYTLPADLNFKLAENGGTISDKVISWISPEVWETGTEQTRTLKVEANCLAKADFSMGTARVTPVEADADPNLDNNSKQAGNLHINTIFASIGDAVAETDENQAVFYVGLNTPCPCDVVIGYQTGDGTAKAGIDYTHTSGVITFFRANDGPNASITVPVLHSQEGDDKIFYVKINTSQGYVDVVNEGIATGIIKGRIPPLPPDENTAAVSIHAHPIRIKEGESSLITVQLDKPAATDITVKIKAEDITTTPEDYTLSGDIIIVKHGDTHSKEENSVTLYAVIDHLYQQDEEVKIVLDEIISGDAKVGAVTEVIITIVSEALPLIPKNNMVIGEENKPYRFSQEDFTYEDLNDSERKLDRVQIFFIGGQMPAQLGSLMLDGETVNNEDIISIADINNKELIYRPVNGLNGIQQLFTFGLYDNKGNSSVSFPNGQMSINLIPASSEGIYGDLIIYAQEGRSSTGTLIAVTPSDDGTAKFFLRTQAMKGTAVVQPNGRYTYTAGNQKGDDYFTVEARDDNGWEATATVQVHIIGENHPPVITLPQDPFTTPVDVPLHIDILQYITDPDGDEKFDIRVTSSPENGTAIWDVQSQHIIYTPNNDFMGNDDFRVFVSDEPSHPGIAASTSATVRVLVVNQVDLAITNVPNPSQAGKIGDTYSYIITVKNLGDTDALNAVMTEYLPSSLEMQNMSSSVGNPVLDANSRRITWNIGGLAAGRQEQMILVVKPVKGGRIVTTAEVWAVNQEQVNPDNNTAIAVKDIMDFIIPNAITPNGNGINDTWAIYGIENMQAEVSIFNRAGTMVFQSNNYQNNWDAAGLPDQTYFYVFKVKASDGTPFVQKGYITVIRTQL